MNRKEFAFQKWLDWDNDLYEKIEASSLNKTRSFSYTITGYDKAPSAIRKAEQNISNANLDDFIKIEEDFLEQKKKTQTNHFIFSLIHPMVSGYLSMLMSFIVG